jgi:predicted amidophosphoribosyltransferase
MSEKECEWCGKMAKVSKDGYCDKCQSKMDEENCKSEEEMFYNTHEDGAEFQ